jgi:type II secretory pathway pseudopilin PulG
MRGRQPATTAAGGRSAAESPGNRSVGGRRGWSRVAGYSLLEVILATAVLAGSGLVVQTLIGMGSRWANQAEARSLALMLAQSVLDAMLAEGLPEGNQLPQLFEEFPEYSYEIEIEPAPTPIPGLVQVRVRIRSTDAALNRLSPNEEAPPLCELHRWVRHRGPDSTGDRSGTGLSDSAGGDPGGENMRPSPGRGGSQGDRALPLSGGARIGP